jgi:DNA-binding response OmpR family regulator
MTAPLHILVVDDDPAVRGLVTEFLTRRGYRVRTAGDGARPR